MQIQTIVMSGACALVLFGGARIGQAADLSPADRQFINTVARTDMTEAHEGQLAENQANRADVKKLAETLVQDHTQSYEQLGELAARKGVSIPKGIEANKNAEIRQLLHLKGNRFDQQFDRLEISDHQRALAIFKREAAHGRDADVKAYAASMIPILEKHLNLAEQCAKQVRHG